jgi:hypothetical protein
LDSKVFAILLEFFSSEVGFVVRYDAVGTQNLETIDLRKLTARVVAADVTGMALIHFVNLSTATRRKV